MYLNYHVPVWYMVIRKTLAFELFFLYLCRQIIKTYLPMEKKKERKQNWKEYTATVEDIQRFLEDHVMLRYNVVTRQVEGHLPPKLGGYRGMNEQNSFTCSDLQPPNLGGYGDLWEPVTDRLVNSLWSEMSREKTVKVQDMYRVIESDFVPEYDPFRFYLDNLPPWNGKDDYLLELSASVMVKGDVEEQLLFADYLKKWLVAMGRDDLLTLARYGLVCCEELDTMRPSELNQLKAAVTMPAINERAAYAHYHEYRRHIASFCGTGNNMQFLSDPTGNRRWLPFEIDGILSPRDFPLNYDGIYSQAYRLYREGFQYWFTQPEIMRLAQHNRQFETPRLEAELVDIYFRKPQEGENGIFMSVARALQLMSGNITQKLSPVFLGRAFGELGFRRVKSGGQRGYIVVCRTADEMHQKQLSMAALAEDDGMDSGQ